MDVYPLWLRYVRQTLRASIYKVLIDCRDSMDKPGDVPLAVQTVYGSIGFVQDLGALPQELYYRLRHGLDTLFPPDESRLAAGDDSPLKDRLGVFMGSVDLLDPGDTV